MHVWNVLHAARCKYGTQKRRKTSPSGHHRTTLSGWIFETKASIDNRKKILKQQYLLHRSAQYGELQPTSGWDRFGSLGHGSKFQRLSRLDSVTARQSGSGRQPNFAALNRGRHLYSAGRPSRCALAHILVIILTELKRIRYYVSHQMTTSSSMNFYLLSHAVSEVSMRARVLRHQLQWWNVSMTNLFWKPFFRQNEYIR